jgi:glycerol-3-phosphate acyltransferase PlsY
MISIVYYLDNYIRYNEHPGVARVLSIMLTTFIIMFSIASVFWFAYIIIYRLLDEQSIKLKLNLYLAIASTVNLIQIPSTNSFILSFSVIIVAYRWIIHFIDDRKTWRKSKLDVNIFSINKGEL